MLNFEVGSYGVDFEKNVILPTSPNLPLGTRLFILAICWLLIIQVSHGMVKDFQDNSKIVERWKTSSKIFQELELKLF